MSTPNPSTDAAMTDQKKQSYWTLTLEANDEHCLRLSHPHGGMLRCWHGQQTYAMLGNHSARELLSLDALLNGKTSRLHKNQVCELLLLAARVAVELENHTHTTSQKNRSRQPDPV